MESAAVAKVAVSAATYAIDKPYDYLIPAALADRAAVGMRVSVPFGRGNRSSEGVILALGTAPRAPGLKALASVLDEEPVLDSAGVALALFLRQRCFCTMYEAVRTILPAGLWYRYRETFRLCLQDREAADAASGHIRGAGAVLDALFSAGGELELEALKAACGESGESAARALCKKGVLCCQTQAQRRVGDKTHCLVTLAVSAEEALAAAEQGGRSSPLRREALRLLAVSSAATAADLCYYTGASLRTIKALEKSGLVRLTQEEELRVPSPDTAEPGLPIVLSEEQEQVFGRLLSLTRQDRPEAALLEGVTGSGKTAVYLRLVQEVLHAGRTAMVLVPEIVLTPQMMRKFASYFGSRVVMLHSGLRLSERYDQWKRIRRGEVDVVLGTRSAVFAPLRRLGLIILDEEQEATYQSENPPRYHTRDVAKFRCAQDKALLLLGSATPSVESAWAARQGIYHHELLRRRFNERALPRVTIADLRQELRSGNAGILSAPLQAELAENLGRGEQSILFLNRRGNSRMLLCGECGQTPQCPRCSVPLTYHSANGRLMCHYCGHSERAYDVCPVCGGRMKRVGTGTQKVEEELRSLFPEAGVVRMDADTAAGGHEKLLRRFEQERVPILLGTQMVAKGLDFENVTLVGVLDADLSLYIDSFRAAERTFALLTQVVGRAGRGDKLGRAVIQTYTPDSAVIRSAAEQNFQRFYDSEIELRRLRRYPPFADLFTFTVSGGEESAVLRAAAFVRDTLRSFLRRTDMPAEPPEVLGPAPAPVVKVNNRYRYRVTLVGKNDRPTRECVSAVLKDFSGRRENRGMGIFVDCNAPD